MATFTINNIFKASDIPGITLAKGTYVINSDATPGSIVVLDDDNVLEDTTESPSNGQTLDTSEQVLDVEFDGHPVGTTVRSRVTGEATVTDPDGNIYTVEVNQVFIGSQTYYVTQADVPAGSTIEVTSWQASGNTDYADLASDPIESIEIDQVIENALGQQIVDSFSTGTAVTVAPTDLNHMTILDNDAVLQDSVDFGDQTLDQNVQNLDGAFLTSVDGAYVFSRGYYEVTNVTTGEVGRLYQIRVDTEWNGLDAPLPDQQYYVFSNDFVIHEGEEIIATSALIGTGDVAYTALMICFTKDTQIATPLGEVAVQDLKAGDKVLTKDGEVKEIRWLGRRKFGAGELVQNAKLFPVRIMAGALGNNLPKQDLVLSRQHRMLVQSPALQSSIGKGEALVKAIHLTDLSGVFVDYTVDEVEYFHILLDDHDIVIANGAPSESLYLGDEALKMLDEDAIEEIMAIFPELKNAEFEFASEYEMLSGKASKNFVESYQTN